MKNLETNQNNKTVISKKAAISLIPVSIVLLYLIAFGIINFGGFLEFLTCDMYSDTLVSKMMWEQKTIFPEGWVFGNQYYVIATPVLAALIYGITGSLNLSMAISTTIMSVLILVSLYYMLSPFLNKNLCFSALAGLCAVVIGIDIYSKIEVQLFFVMASYYACYLIGYFIVLGDYLRGVFSCKKNLSLNFMLSLVLCFCLGMQSLRQTIIMILPLLAFEGLRVLVGLLKKSKCIDFKPSLRVILYSVSNIAGVIFIRILNIPAVTIYGGFEFSKPEEWGINLDTAIRALGSVTGLRYGDIYEPKFFIILFSLISILLVVYALIKIAFFTHKKLDGFEAAILISALSIVILFVGSIFVNINVRSVYFFVWYVLVTLSAVYFMRSFKRNGKVFAASFLCALALLNLYFSYYPPIEKVFKAKEVYTVSEELADILEESGYEIVYGSWSPVALSVAKTDGELVLGAWHAGVFRVLPYINIINIYTEEHNSRALYVIGYEDINTARELAAASGAKLTFIKRVGNYGIYTSSKQLMWFGE